MQPKDSQYTVPANRILVILDSVREISSAQYERLLLQADWGRFLAAPPPPGATPVATEDEVRRLYQTVYLVLGESLTRLFLRNYGRALAGQMLHAPWAAPTLEPLKDLPPDQQLSGLIAGMQKVGRGNAVQNIVTEDATAWYMEYHPCPTCGGIQGATAPLCANIEALYNTLAKTLFGRHIRIVEIACAAQGDPYCKFAFYKEPLQAV